VEAKAVAEGRVPPGKPPPLVEARPATAGAPGNEIEVNRTEEGHMPDITTPRDLFLHELGDILYVEKNLTGEVLPKLIDEVQDPDFRKGLERHLEQTKGHVTNLEQIFDSMGEQSETEKCLGFEGLKKEHDEMIGEVSEGLVDMVDAGAAARTEHYEIAAYNGLIEMARALGEREAVGLLEENLKEEREALNEVESVAKKLRDETKATAA
jgi:ferritin-like metal-binding protein YciE